MCVWHTSTLNCVVQIGFEQQWLEVIKKYVVPVQEKVFPGYHSKVSTSQWSCDYHDLCSLQGHAIMNFVVKYHPQGQSNLRPHHDSSTFTINVALSRPGVDHEVRQLLAARCAFIRACPPYFREVDVGSCATTAV